MQSFFASLGFVARRMRAQWRLLTVVGVGVLVASILMASTSIYTRALSDLGLGFQLENRVGAEGPVTTVVPGVLAGGERSAEVRQFATDSVDARFGTLSSGRLRSGESRAFTAELPAFASAPNPAGVIFSSLQNLEEFVTVVEGRLPDPLVVVTDLELGFTRAARPIEIVIPLPQLARSGLEVGETIQVTDRFDECDREPPGPPGAPPPPPVPPCVPTFGIRMSFTAQLVGVIDRVDGEADVWAGVETAWETAPSLPLVGPVFTMFAHDETLFGSFGEILPGQLLKTIWSDTLPTENFDVSVVNPTQASFDALRNDIRQVGGVVRSPIESTLDNFQRDLNFTQVPILLLLIQIVAIVLFYVVIVSTMLVEREEPEIALLRSRGGSLRQMLSLYATEGVVIGIVAVVAGPFLASLIINALGFTSTFSEVTGGDAIDTTLQMGAWALAAGGAIFAVVAILVPVTIASRDATSEQRKRAARPAGQNVIQRYFLDIAAAVIAVGLIFEADLRGSAFERNSVGGLSSDPLVLVTPTLFALVFAIVLLRVLPFLFRIVSFIVHNHVGVSTSAALRQTVRNPGPPMRLTLLLMLGAALGTFAASYGGTVDRSFDERVRYAAGVDLRASLANFPDRPPGLIEENFSEVVGIESTSPVYRAQVSTARTGNLGQTIDLLALDPTRARDLLFFRDDLAESSLDDLMRSIETPNVGQGIRLPNDPGEITLWAKPSQPRDDMTVWLRLKDGNDRFTQVRMGTLDIQNEWQQLTGDLGAAFGSIRGVPPFSLHSLFMTEIFGGTFGDPGFILFDAIEVTDSTGAPFVSTGAGALKRDFETPGLGWQRIEVRSDRLDDIEQLQTDDAISGDHVLKFTWALGSSTGRRGFYVEDPGLCPGGTQCRVPVVGSTNFLEDRGLEVGSTTSLRIQDLVVPVVVAEEAEFFPTINPDDGGFMVANLDDLFYFSSVQDFDSVVFPNEAWFVGPNDAELRESVIEVLAFRPFQLNDFVDQQELLDLEGSDPLTAAGGSGILLVSFVAVGTLIGLAFLVTVYITAQRRMVEMAVMRTLGLSSRQILAQLTIEYGAIVAIGLAVGTILGTRITRLMLSFLEVTELGTPVRPPFVIDTDWTVVAISYAGLVLVFVVGVSGAWRFFARLALSRVLRLSE